MLYRIFLFLKSKFRPCFGLELVKAVPVKVTHKVSTENCGSPRAESPLPGSLGIFLHSAEAPTETQPQQQRILPRFNAK